MTETGETGENKAVLHWDATFGFELDLDWLDDEIALRMVRVPVPADGTERLRQDEPVELYPLDTLFKTHVDVDDAPGQLSEVGVRLKTGSGLSLLLTATLEDAETGQTRPLKLELPVALPVGAPLKDGPFPMPPDEDALDWEDEETLEQMISSAPEGVRRPPKDEEPEPTGQEIGLEALLRALISTPRSDDPTPVAPEERVGEPRDEDPILGDEEDAQQDALLDELLHSVAREMAPPQPSDRLMSADEESKSLLDLLVKEEHLELVEGHGTVELAPGLSVLLARPEPAMAKAMRVSEWLLEQDAVEELYVGDDELGEIIDQW